MLDSYIRTGRPSTRTTVNSVAEKRRSSCALAARNFCRTKAGKLSLSPSDVGAILLRDVITSDEDFSFTAQASDTRTGP